MYKYINKPMYHTQTAVIPRALTYEPVWQSTNHHIHTLVKLANNLEKPLLYQSVQSIEDNIINTPKFSWNHLHPISVGRVTVELVT